MANDLEMREGGSSENPIVLDVEEDKETSPPRIPESDLTSQVAQKLSLRKTD